jgi:hypothetical protein
MVFEKMPAIIRQRVNYGPLLGPDEMTSREASELASVSMECVRKWVTKYRIGQWHQRLGLYIIDRARLEEFLAQRGRRAG